MDLNLMSAVPWLVLAVLFAPLLAAAAVAALGKAGPRPARGFAVYFAAFHLLLTAGVVFFTVVDADARGGFPSRQRAEPSEVRFSPRFVPGDPAVVSGDTANSHSTGWTLLSLADRGRSAVAPPAVQFFVGMDGLNVWLVAVTSLLVFLAVLVSWGGVADRAGAFYGWLFLLQTGITGAFLAFDAMLFYVFFELTLIPAFFLIGHWGVGGGRRDAARKFFLYTLFGSLFTLVGIVGVVLTNPIPLDPNSPTPRPLTESGMTVEGPDGITRVVLPKAGPVTFSIPRLMTNVGLWGGMHVRLVETTRHRAAQARGQAAVATDPARREAARRAAEAAEAELAAAEKAWGDRRQVQFWLFLALMAGFAVKVPVFPFHTWLPAAYAEAPTGVVMILSGLLAKLGTFGILRLVIPLTPDAAVEHGMTVFGTLGAVGIVYAAFCAFAQRDAKLLIAYSSVSHLGLLVLGLFALNTEAVTGAVLHMVNHAVSTGAMFALLGFLYERYRTTDMTRFGGLWDRYPAYTFFVFVAALASVGLPGLCNFVGEMLMMAGLFSGWNLARHGYWPGVVAAAGIFLSAWYTLTMIRRMFFGPVREPAGVAGAAAPPTDVTGREAVAFGIMAALCLLLGLFPQALIGPMRGDVGVVAEVAEHARWRLDPLNYQRPRAAHPDPTTGRTEGRGRPDRPALAPPPRPAAGGR